jgi:RsiW-degrading membrane proteinase PrsW (M82 family)
VIFVGAGISMLLPSWFSNLTGSPTVFGIAMLFTGIFGALMVWLITRLTALDPKPGSIYAGALLFGAFAATALVQVASQPMNTILQSVFSDDALSGAFAAATIEEIYKALGVVLVFLIAPWWWRRTIDGLVIGALVGLGFQMFEDIQYFMMGSSGDANPMARAFEIFVDRILLTGFISHAAYTGLFGAAFAFAVTRKDESNAMRWGTALLGLLAAWLAHLYWDLPFLTSLTEMPAGVAIYAVVKSLPFALLVIYVAFRAIKTERLDFELYADPEIEAGTIEDDEAEVLADWRSRATARRAVKKESGREASDDLHHLQRAQLSTVQLHIQELASPEVLADQRALVSSLRPVPPSQGGTDGTE